MGLLETLMRRATTPLWKPSQETTDANTKQTADAAPFQQEPSLDPNMFLRLLSDQTTPANIALTAAPMAGSIARGGKALVGGARGLAGVTPELVEAAPAVRQVLPAAEDTVNLAKTLKDRLMQIPTGKAKMPVMDGEFTHTGNVLPNPIDAARVAARPSRVATRYAANPPRIYGQAGEIDPKLLAGGAGLAAGGYGIHKLMGILNGIKDPNSVVHKASPFSRVSDILDEAGQVK